ncbi:proton-dependent oligopeptide transporter family [Artemisia annua]|uniref:Proton-dependent oligopeptide transporter family n=1 Tax=Artemisia annua TaxID=35608 RepID=A0A2U1PQR4_ARTAN|nr:proton-dependent oligopeptide transporter family [Artemisia annua]
MLYCQGPTCKTKVALRTGSFTLTKHFQISKVRTETRPEDVGGMHAAVGILTARGGMTLHTAVVACGWGKCCVSGCADIHVNDNIKIHMKRIFVAYSDTCLVFSRSLTNYAVVSILMWYFTYYEGKLVMSAVLSNIQEALSSIFVIVMANIADSFIGTYRTLLFSNTAYIGGLWLMWMFNPYDVKWLIVIILVLLAFGTSGANLVDNMLIDLVKDIDNSQDEEISNARAAFWSNVAEVSGAVSAAMWVANDSIGGVKESWRTTFLICIISMMTTLVIFAKGYKVYHQDKLIQRPIKMFLRVCRRRRSTSRHLTSRHEPSLPDLETTSREEETHEHDKKVHRLNEVRHLDDQSTATSISFLWLLPQFCVLGCMEGLTNDGLLRFFKSKINDIELEKYGEEYIELVMGFGKLFNIALILICKSQLGWFSDTINDSQLDKYYRILVYVCSVNFVYYCVIATFGSRMLKIMKTWFICISSCLR